MSKLMPAEAHFDSNSLVSFIDKLGILFDHPVVTFLQVSTRSCPLKLPTFTQHNLALMSSVLL